MLTLFRIVGIVHNKCESAIVGHTDVFIDIDIEIEMDMNNDTDIEVDIDGDIN